MAGDRDTIAAISTAMGSSGIGIIRISGDDAIQVANRIFRGKDLREQPTHTIHYGFIEEGGQALDEVLVTVMRAPRTFTAENTVEINCHGGIYALRRVLEAVFRSGARPAEPGEFTKRAFLNGRIDLSQAEAVMDVIQAKNAYALQASVSQLKGSVQEAVRGLRDRILYQTAFIESALDDPEHYSLDGYPAMLYSEVEDLLSELERLIASSENGRILKEGIRTVILGKPNAGKSSLLNALLDEDRAIVTEVEGTTRDVLEESISLGDLTLIIQDTAGIRDTADIVEKIGVERARKAAQGADLILYVVDASRELDEDDQEILRVIQDKKTFLLLNKSDLPAVVTTEKLTEKTGGKYPVLTISALRRQGIEELTKVLKEFFYQGDLSFNDQVIITSARQKYCLAEAKESLHKVRQSIEEGMPEDFFSIDLMDAYQALGEIIGEALGEDLVDEIFRQFCMGK